ncbi:hypothetical protein [Polluticoccus soli]|uniref:hypothetical protein n=1 Tax=Polluticoccus soli TaxID=3034150 RepID=UPI0023E1F1A8|nr:hypothetical protein [Flavipsychrobacter sp. JY13-12]
MSSPVQLVFDKIREISARGIDPRPFIHFEELRSELRISADALGPLLVHLKKMGVIIFDRKAMTAIKLTLLGLQSEYHPD